MFSKKMFLFILILSLSITVLPQSGKITEGIKLIKNERYSEAKNYFKALLNGDTKAEAGFYLGQIYFTEGRYDSAEIFYKNGIRADDDFSLNYAGLAKVYELIKKNSEREKYEIEALDMDEKNPQVYLVLSEAYTKGDPKNYKKAENLVEQAIKLDNENIDAHILLGKISVEKGDGTAAIGNLQHALNIDNNNAEALTLKARVYIMIKNYKESLSLLNEALLNDPSYSPAYFQMSELYSVQKDYSNAVRYYEKYIESSEVTPDKRKNFASVLFLNKQYSETINILEDLLNSDKNNPSFIRILAYSYLRSGNIEKSKEYFGKLFGLPSVEYLPGDYENYADLLNKTGNDSMAIEYLYKIADLDQSRRDILGRISVIQFQNKNWPGVIEALERKVNLTAQEYFDLGKAYYFIQDYPKADSSFNLLTEKAAELAIAYFWQARVKTNFDPESEAGTAKPYYEEFIALSRDDTVKFRKELVEAYSYLGYYFYLKDDKESSLGNWEKVAGIDPNNEQAKAAIKELRKK